MNSPNELYVEVDYIDYIEQHCLKYNITLARVRRLSGKYGLEIKLLIYILRIKFGISFGMIAIHLRLTRGIATYNYYDVLGNSILREIAESKFKEVINAGII